MQRPDHRYRKKKHDYISDDIWQASPGIYDDDIHTISAGDTRIPIRSERSTHEEEEDSADEDICGKHYYENVAEDTEDTC
ncbi:hypothetical protein N7540_006682 [Penicillium herquei]|nr:hypothetical protein N7540_006682 [Penicillium herquei]